MNNEPAGMPAVPSEATAEQGATVQAQTTNPAIETPSATATAERPTPKMLAIVCAIAIAGGLLGGILGGIAVTSTSDAGQAGGGPSSSSQSMGMGGPADGQAPDGMEADGTDNGSLSPTMPDGAESGETPTEPDAALSEGTETSDGTQSASDTSGSVLTPRSDGSLAA